jgi:hypothetical protein
VGSSTGRLRAGIETIWYGLAGAQPFPIKGSGCRELEESCDARRRPVAHLLGCFGRLTASAESRTHLIGTGGSYLQVKPVRRH